MDHLLIYKIQLPGREPVDHSFRKTDKIVEVIEWAANYYGIPVSDSLILDYNGTTLERERTLVSYHIPENNILILSDNSGGV